MLDKVRQSMEDDSKSREFKKLTRKHLAERQRRARINSHLKDIQELTRTSTNRGEKLKLEKAEVLETALQYLQNAQDIEPNNNTIFDPDIQELQAYEEGFRECMTNILDSFDESGLFTEVASGLRGHLESVLHQTVTNWESGTFISGDKEKIDMAFSPSLARLEQCLLKFETGHMTGSDVMGGRNIRRGSEDLKGSDFLKGSDVSSDSSQCETGSNNDIAQNHVTGTITTDFSGLESGPDANPGSTINEWVNMQREYVVQQQLMFQYHQQQHHHQQQQHFHEYQQLYQQSLYPCHALSQDMNELQGMNDGGCDINDVMNCKVVKETIHKDLNEDQIKVASTSIKQEVWRPW